MNQRIRVKRDKRFQERLNERLNVLTRRPRKSLPNKAAISFYAAPARLKPLRACRNGSLLPNCGGRHDRRIQGPDTAARDRCASARAQTPRRRGEERPSPASQRIARPSPDGRVCPSPKHREPSNGLREHAVTRWAARTIPNGCPSRTLKDTARQQTSARLTPSRRGTRSTGRRG